VGSAADEIAAAKGKKKKKASKNLSAEMRALHDKKHAENTKLLNRRKNCSSWCSIP
jgi:hypothetical protein